MNAQGSDRGGSEPVEWSATIAPEKVCELILRVREFQAKDVADELDDGSNPSDDGMRVILEDKPNDAVESEIRDFIGGLNIDERIDLVALAWLGRGDASRQEWTSLRAEAAREHGDRTAASYLIAMPLVADYLADALSEFGQTCGD
jgi:hypothetical protein